MEGRRAVLEEMYAAATGASSVRAAAEAKRAIRAAHLDAAERAEAATYLCENQM